MTVKHSTGTFGVETGLLAVEVNKQFTPKLPSSDSTDAQIPSVEDSTAYSFSF